MEDRAEFQRVGEGQRRVLEGCWRTGESARGLLEDWGECQRVVGGLGRVPEGC